MLIAVCSVILLFESRILGSTKGWVTVRVPGFCSTGVGARGPDSRVEAFFAGAHSLIEGLTDAAVEDAKQRLLARKRPQPLARGPLLGGGG